MCNRRDIINLTGSSIMCLHSGCRTYPSDNSTSHATKHPTQPHAGVWDKSFWFSFPVSNFEHLFSCASVKFPEGLAEFMTFLPSDICSSFPLQFHLAGDLSIVSALFPLLGEKTQAVQPLSDCSHPKQFTVSLTAQNTSVPGITNNFL